MGPEYLLAKFLHILIAIVALGTSLIRMKLVSINVGLPREARWNGKTVLTSIFKTAVKGSVRVRRLNVDGDRQSDLAATQDGEEPN
jgi:hypothetical protein